MNQFNVNVYFTQLDGRWFAATNTAPYLCFEGESDIELIDKLKRAFAFYRTAFEEHDIEGREPAVRPFQIKKTINVCELEVAK